MDERCGVKDFYAGRSVFVTGATGFMGKVLVEKLLRTCERMGNIYVLLRPSKGKDARQRLEELLDSKIFKNWKANSTGALDKLIPICGDVGLPSLGICETDEKLLTDNVSVVFHLAATLNFNEKLKKAVNINVRGTKRVIDLCRNMTKLSALICVSTAYSNCNRYEIDETIYPVFANSMKMIEMIELMDDDLVDSITPQLLGNRKNAYVFTKALSEQLLAEERGNLPVAIMRPSMVVASCNDPFPGWIDSLNGPAGLAVGFGKGLLRSAYVLVEKCADFIPVDMAINIIISTAWYMDTFKPNNMLIYNCTSGNVNGITWGQFESKLRQLLWSHPFNQTVWYPSLWLIRNKLYHNIYSTFSLFYPGYFVNAMALASGRKPVFVRFQRKIYNAFSNLERFTTNEWRFNNSNVFTLLDALSPECKQEFDFDLRKVHWPTFLEQNYMGIKTFILEDDASDVPRARSQMRKLYVVHRMSQMVGIFLIWRLLGMCFPTSMLPSWPATVASIVDKLASVLPSSSAISD